MCRPSLQDSRLFGPLDTGEKQQADSSKTDSTLSTWNYPFRSLLVYKKGRREGRTLKVQLHCAEESARARFQRPEELRPPTESSLLYLCDALPYLLALARSHSSAALCRCG